MVLILHPLYTRILFLCCSVFAIFDFDCFSVQVSGDDAIWISLFSSVLVPVSYVAVLTHSHQNFCRFDVATTKLLVPLQQSKRVYITL